MNHPSVALTHPRCTQWGHKYQARYDVKRPESFDVATFRGSITAHTKFMNNISDHTYVHDICVRCGRTIERNKT